MCYYSTYVLYTVLRLYQYVLTCIQMHYHNCTNYNDVPSDYNVKEGEKCIQSYDNKHRCRKYICLNHMHDCRRSIDVGAVVGMFVEC